MNYQKARWEIIGDKKSISYNEIGAFYAYRSSFFTKEVHAIFTIPDTLLRSWEKQVGKSVRNPSDVPETYYKDFCKNALKMSTSDVKYIELRKSEHHLDVSNLSWNTVAVAMKVNGIDPSKENHIERLEKEMSRAKTRIESRFC